MKKEISRLESKLLSIDNHHIPKTNVEELCFCDSDTTDACSAILFACEEDLKQCTSKNIDAELSLDECREHSATQSFDLEECQAKLNLAKNMSKILWAVCTFASLVFYCMHN